MVRHRTGTRACPARFRSETASKIGEAARLYRLTGEARYAEWAAGQLDFYAENYEKFPRLPKPRAGSKMMFQSLDEATMLTRFIDAVRLLGDAAPADRRRRWFEGLFRPQCELLNGTMQTIHNIAC